MRWQITRIYVLKPFDWISFRTNELTSGMKLPGGSPRKGGTACEAGKIADSGGVIYPFIADEYRTQRNTLALRNVDYMITATIAMTDKAGPRDTPEKFSQMFRRRLYIGQHYQMPYFGIREFVADVEPVDPNNPPTPIQVTSDLGWMLYDVNYSLPEKKAFVFQARMERGIINIPSPEEARAMGDIDVTASLAPVG
jgi:CRISPR-associated protein Cas5d